MNSTRKDGILSSEGQNEWMKLISNPLMCDPSWSCNVIGNKVKICTRNWCHRADKSEPVYRNPIEHVGTSKRICKVPFKDINQELLQEFEVLWGTLVGNANLIGHDHKMPVSQWFSAVIVLAMLKTKDTLDVRNFSVFHNLLVASFPHVQELSS